MRIVRIFRTAVVVLACHGILFPVNPLTATDLHEPGPPEAATVASDVELLPGGLLNGRLHDTNGKPLADHELVLTDQSTGRRIVCTTDPEGRFTATELRGGVYQVAADENVSVCRLWAPDTAPPHARHRLLVVKGLQVERGQRPLADAIFSTPTLLVLMIVAAIAIPIAVHNSKDAS